MPGGLGWPALGTALGEYICCWRYGGAAPAFGGGAGSSAPPLPRGRGSSLLCADKILSVCHENARGATAGLPEDITGATPGAGLPEDLAFAPEMAPVAVSAWDSAWVLFAPGMTAPEPAPGAIAPGAGETDKGAGASGLLSCIGPGIATPDGGSTAGSSTGGVLSRLYGAVTGWEAGMPPMCTAPHPTAGALQEAAPVAC